MPTRCEDSAPSTPARISSPAPRLGSLNPKIPVEARKTALEMSPRRFEPAGLGPTDFYTSAETRGFDFVAVKPRARGASARPWALRALGVATLTVAVAAAAARRARS